MNEEIMKAQYSIDDNQISDMNMSITLTATVSQWREIMRAETKVADYHPISKVQNMISAALSDLANATEKKYSVDEWMHKDNE
jgi:hypothetical protein